MSSVFHIVLCSVLVLSTRLVWASASSPHVPIATCYHPNRGGAKDYRDTNRKDRRRDIHWTESDSQRRHSHKKIGGRPIRKPSRSSSLLSSLTHLVQSTVDISANLAQSALQTTGKAAYHLVTPKYISKQELVGLWRLDQVILSNQDAISCVANVEFTNKGDATTLYNHTEYKHPYFFKQKSWPRSCSIEFQAYAFQYKQDNHAVKYYYKGYFRRKLADPSVIKIVGKIYQVEQIPRLNRFFSPNQKRDSTRPGIEVGTFVARRRLSRDRLDIPMEEEEEEEYGEDEDDEEEEWEPEENSDEESMEEEYDYEQQ